MWKSVSSCVTWSHFHQLLPQWGCSTPSSSLCLDHTESLLMDCMPAVHCTWNAFLLAFAHQMSFHLPLLNLNVRMTSTDFSHKVFLPYFHFLSFKFLIPCTGDFNWKALHMLNVRHTALLTCTTSPSLLWLQCHVIHVIVVYTCGIQYDDSIHIYNE